MACGLSKRCDARCQVLFRCFMRWIDCCIARAFPLALGHSATKRKVSKMYAVTKAVAQRYMRLCLTLHCVRLNRSGLSGRRLCKMLCPKEATNACSMYFTKPSREMDPCTGMLSWRRICFPDCSTRLCICCSCGRSRVELRKARGLVPKCYT